MAGKVFSIGEALIDFVPTRTGLELKEVDVFNRAPGGAPANVAASVAKLGLNASFIGKLGKDAFGDYLIQILKEQGVSDECISRTSEAKTALAFVSLKRDGDRDFMFYRDPSADMLLTESDIEKEWFSKDDILHYGSISLIQEPSKGATELAIRYARENGALISFDPNIRLSLWPNKETAVTIILEHVPLADILKVSEEEVELLSGKSSDEGVKELFVGNVKLVLVTLGSRGSIVYTKQSRVELDGFKVEVVDTTGSGDAFIAGVLYMLVKEGANADNIREKLIDEDFLRNIALFGNANGALTATKAGAISALPDLEQVMDMVNGSEGNKSDMLAQANKTVWQNHKEASKCPYRLNYHIMAPSGWINDPNGLVQFNGEYHVFYQHHPFSSEWGPMHWGHVVSRDLVHWEHKPIALAPDQEYEKGCFSGSAVDDNGTLTLIYTAHDDMRKPKQVQCIATSRDGINFVKSSKNPVVAQPPVDGSEDFRDPKVWKHEDKWYMILATGKDGNGKAVLYYSEDLRVWIYSGVVCESDGTQGDIWECPDLFELGDKHVLMTSPMNMKNGKNIFIIGHMDYKTNKFTQLKYQEADFGENFYAAQSFMDYKGRRIAIAWMDMWGKQFPTKKSGWAGALTIPRELSLKGDRVITRPVEELKQLRLNESSYKNLIVKDKDSGYLKDIEGDSLEIKARFRIVDASCLRFGFFIRSSEDYKEKTVVYYDLRTGELAVDKTQSGEQGDKSENRMAISLQEDNTFELQIFVDKSSVEVFANEGEIVASNRIYPSEKSVNYDVFTVGGDIEVEYLYAWKLKSI